MTATDAAILRDLGHGLILRRATAADIPALLEVHARAYDRDPAVTDEAELAHMRDLLERPHPAFNGRDMTLVEDTRAGVIVSAQHFSEHTLSYAGVEFPAGEIEHVSTRPDYQRRGLIRAQTEVMHGWSAERGHLAQIINGIPWYYTLFGYELALEKWCGRHLRRDAVPPLPTAEERYRLRPATTADLPFIGEVYDHGRQRYLVSYPRPPHLWRYDLEQRDPVNRWYRRIEVIETAAGEPAGFLSYRPQTLMLEVFELAPGVPWATVTPAVACALSARATQIEAMGGARVRLIDLGWLDEAHPAFAACPDLFVAPPRLGAWYVRVPDLTAFVRRIVPALEARLDASLCAGVSGRLTLNFFRDEGLALDLERGRIRSVETWRPPSMFDGDARFADLTFSQLLFGYRSLEELERAFVYRVIARPEARVLLDALFPKQTSNLLPVY